MIRAFVFIFLFFGFVLYSEESYCPFCDPKILDYQVFYEDDIVLGLYTHKPSVEGHSLIIPKRHVERYEELTDEEILRVSDLIKKTHHAVSKAYGKEHYLILEKNGREAGQEVFHVHFHLIPTAEGSSRLYYLAKILLRPLFSPISERTMKENIEKIRKHM